MPFITPVSEEEAVAVVRLSRGPGTYGDVEVTYAVNSGTALLDYDFRLN